MLGFLDVAVVMTFVFSVFSIVCSAIAEIVESLVKRRARMLREAVHRLLLGDAQLIRRFLGSGLVRSMAVEDGQSPSYIQARTFALAFVDAASNGDVQKALEDPGSLLAALGSSPAAGVVRPLLAEAEGDAQRLLRGLERWFDDEMERVSGWYKRYAQWVLLAIGLAAAIAWNVDSVAIFRAVSADSVLRQAAAAAATEYARARTAPTAASGAEPRTLDLAAAAAEAVGAAELPIGWSSSGGSRPRNAPWERLLGWALTALAASFGAPFWFDLLNRMVNVRAALKPDGNAHNTVRRRGKDGSG